MAATDDYSSLALVPSGPCRRAATVTPNDGTDLTNVARVLYVGGAGNLVLVTSGGDTVTLIAVPVGTFIRDLSVARVKATGTTATNITAHW